MPKSSTTTTLAAAIETLKSRQAERAAAADRVVRAEAGLKAIDDALAALVDPPRPLADQLATLRVAARLGEADVGAPDAWLRKNVTAIGAESMAADDVRARRRALHDERAAMVGVHESAVAALRALPAPVDELTTVYGEVMADAGNAVLEAAENLLKAHRRALALAHIARMQTSVTVYRDGSLYRREEGDPFVSAPLADDGTPTTTRLGVVAGQDRERREAVNHGFASGPRGEDLTAARAEIEALGVRLLQPAELRVDLPPLAAPVAFVTTPDAPRVPA